MKISKLFHWLYALLMLLPAFFVGGRMLYVTFNKNAKDSYSGANGYSIQYKYETNVVNQLSDLKQGNIYKLDTSLIDLDSITNMTKLVDTTHIYLLEFKSSINIDYYDVNSGGVTGLFFNGGNGNYYIYANNNNTNLNGVQVGRYITFVYYANLNTTYVPFSAILPSDYNEIEGVTISNVGTLDNAFDYSMNQINELPLFSWAKDSFLVEPFAYIGDLFGLPEESPIITLLSYWLDISLIWLVFDLLMYVPLLAHRWLDKGVLE